MMKNLVIVAATAAFAATAQAELVVNGGFETGNFSGWTQVGDTGFTSVWGTASHGGSFNAYFGPVTPGGIEQALVAAAGSVINVSFWVRSEDELTPNSLNVTLDGQSVAALSDITVTDWTQYSATITVTNANPVLNFTLTNPNGYTDLDDISADIVPAPASVALLGLGGLLAARRRRA